MVFREIDPTRSYVTVLQFKEHVSRFGAVPKIESRERIGNVPVASGATWHALTFDTELKNEDGDLFGYDAGKLVSKAAMLLELKASNVFLPDATGQREIKVARYDSSGTFIEEGGNIRHDAASSGGTKQSTSYTFLMDEGDYLQVEVRQTSGGSLDSNSVKYVRECRRLD